MFKALATLAGTAAAWKYNYPSGHMPPAPEPQAPEIPEPADFTCDYRGYKTCTEQLECPHGYYFNEYSCQCFMQYQCPKRQLRCEYGETLDPREYCACASVDEVNSLYMCEYSCDNTQESCELENPNFVLNEKSCECECQLECGYGQEKDEENCQCIDVPVQGDFECDYYGRKQCSGGVLGDADTKLECPEGLYFNPYSCDCFSQFQCKKKCPYGQTLDPREYCECVDSAEVWDLYSCEREECEKTQETCEADNVNFVLNEKSCECECQLECGYGQEADEENCQCIDIPVQGDFECDYYGRKSCTGGVLGDEDTELVCPENFYQNPYSCDCFSKFQCKKKCPYGATLDPREFCECASIAEVQALYTCQPDACDLTQESCEALNLNFVLNEKKCECECNAQCGYGEMLDTANCACVAVDVQGDFECNAYGQKQCTEKLECPEGMYQNPYSCDCFASQQCRIKCPWGSTLDPRKPCECVAKEEVAQLFTCVPPPPQCTLTKAQCGYGLWSVDEENCKCVCEAECEEGQTLNEQYCQCIDDPKPMPPSPYNPYGGWGQGAQGWGQAS